MIVQPFVENAIEHGLRPKKEGKLNIEFHLTDNENTLLCSIQDDGVGYNKGKEKQLRAPEFQSHRSRGLEITRDRLTLLHQLRKTPAVQFIRIIDLEEQDIEARRKAIQVARQVWREQDKARAGVIVTVGRDGSAEIRHCLVGHPRGRRFQQSSATRHSCSPLRTQPSTAG